MDHRMQKYSLHNDKHIDSKNKVLLIFPTSQHQYGVLHAVDHHMFPTAFYSSGQKLKMTRKTTSETHTKVVWKS